MDIDKMGAGEELDILVAEKVMAWRFIHDGMGNMAWVTPLSRETGYGDGGVAGHSRKWWRPSTDISCIWEVVKVLRDEGWYFAFADLSGDAGPDWEAAVNDGHHRWNPIAVAHGETLMEAGCKAALKAVSNV